MKRVQEIVPFFVTANQLFRFFDLYLAYETTFLSPPALFVIR